MRGPRTLIVLAVLIALPPLCGCGGAPRPRETPDLLAYLESPVPSERAWAVSEICRTRDASGLPAMVEMLRDEDGGIRVMASGGLREWTGQDHGYRPFAPEAEREAAIKRWEAWLEAGGAP